MHRISKTYLYINLLGLLMLVYSCSQEGSPEAPPAKDLLAKSWQIESIETAGQRISHAGFSIQFYPNGDFNFTTQGIPGFPNSGKWVLNTDRNEIILNSNIALKIIGRIQANKLVFEYTYKNHKMGDVVTQFNLK
ncbi:hypothetical protein ACFOUP_18490 [Belliella kenyensis]|uniref:Lipocalin-like domain-containing protein n=1 Tax=Belliella kenyensis TaxID=1472724 RepID=A0ABV8ESR9_9BACT|nr:hypothetical protein [Belliella kenyensis]MCH7402234.1 hypothetical protein [Belliella kenyensis]MDN3601748.1 hypothetical protein [Belliella kenyensis]